MSYQQQHNQKQYYQQQSHHQQQYSQQPQQYQYQEQQQQSHGELITNQYKVLLNDNLSIHCFSFSTNPPIDPAILNKKTRFLGRRFSKQILEQLPTCLIGSSLVYTPAQSSQVSSTKYDLGMFELLDKESQLNQELQLSLEFNKTITQASHPAEVYNILGQLMRSFQSNVKEFRQLGATKRFAMNCIQHINSNIRAVLGVDTFFKFNKFCGYHLSVDYCIKIFNNTTVYEYLRKNIPLGAALLNEKVANQLVQTRYGQKRIYKITGVDFDMNPSCTFEIREKDDQTKRRSVSYAQYYQSQHGEIIKDVKQPLLIVELKKKNKVNQVQKDNQQKQQNNENKNNNVIYLIPELCYMMGIPEENQNDFQLKKAITEVSQPRARERQDHCKSYVENVVKKNEKQLSDWQLNIDQNTPITAQYSTLNPGSLLMQRNKEVPIQGERQLDRKIQDLMYQPCVLNKWCAICQESDQTLAGGFMRMLQNRMNIHGIQFAEPRYFSLKSNSQQEIKQLLDEIPEDVEFILFILQGPKSKGKNYQFVKNYLTSTKPIPSQVVLQGTIKNSKDGCQVICNKICNQICTKLGGIPYTVKDLPFSDIPTMIIAVDIYHKLNQKSLYSFVCSVDQTFCRYFSGVQILASTSECNIHVGQLLQKGLDCFKKISQVFPQRIIMYRTSMNSNRSNNSPMQQEIQSIKACLAENSIGDTCKLHIQGVNHSDKTKFYYADYTNPFSGTLIDSGIIGNDGDFFLVSQKTTQGTSTPTMYTELYSDFKDEELQSIRQKLSLLTYRMSYLFYNFTGPVKIPGILKYAESQIKFIKNNLNEGLGQLPENYLLLPEKLAKSCATYYI